MNEVYRKLTEEIKKHNHIFLMAHKNIDLDGFGSIAALYKIIESFGKECYLFRDELEENMSILKSYLNLEKDNIEFSYVAKDNYLQYIQNDSLVIILDTHKKEMLECSDILNYVKDVIVIDHHIASKDVIANTIFTSINADLSSMNEFLTGYLRYLNKIVPPTLATIMLAGIEVDTNSFNTKTTVKTYEAASFLAGLGADNVLKQELLQEKKQIYIQRQKLIFNSFTVGKNFEVCVLDDKIYERKDLAIISEELLKFENIEASFTIGKAGSNLIGISARSLGHIDVEKYMSMLGGGGHMTDAAVQFEGKTLKEVKELLLDVLERR